MYWQNNFNKKITDTSSIKFLLLIHMYVTCSLTLDSNILVCV